MKQLLALRHVIFEDLGGFAPALERLGYAIRYHEAWDGGVADLDPLAPDLVVVLGAPLGIYDEPDFPFIGDEVRLVERRMAADRPTLGICFGSQVMAKALGARVYPGGRKEIGWSPLALTAAGRSSCLAAVGPNETQVLHWHGDTFDLPAGSVHLASSAVYPNQAFAWGRAGLALQFHIEATARNLEAWFVGHLDEIVATPGIDIPTLRRDTARWAPLLERQSIACLEAWLRDIGA